MGDIIGGAIFMGLFIAYVIWKNKKSGKITDSESRLRDDRYRPEEDDDSSGGFFSFSMGSSGDHDGDDDGDGGDDD